MASTSLIPPNVTRAVVLGVGDFGSGAEAALALRALGLNVIITDTRPASAFPEEQLARLAAAGVTFIAGKNPDWLVDGNTLLVPAPSIPLSHKLVLKAGHVMSDLALLLAAAKGPVVGVTGSNGKTTTTAWLHHILKQSAGGAILGGNIGIPAAKLISVARRSPCPVALEVSSWQAEYLSLAGLGPKVMVFTNFTPNHLDHYATLDDYRQAKRGIIRHVPNDGTLVINRDDEMWTWPENFRGTILGFGELKPDSPAGVFFDNQHIVVTDGKGKAAQIGDTSVVPLPGRHNLYNLCAAIGAAQALGVEPKEAFKRSLGFEGVEHRLEKVLTVKGVTFYDDSSSTTPESTLIAVNAFTPPPVVIIGGRNKGMDVELLAKGLKKASGVVLIGEMGKVLKKMLGKTTPYVYLASDMSDAVKKCLAFALETGSHAVALSPAFASFDMFKNYKHRGQVFKDEVRKLAKL